MSLASRCGIRLGCEGRCTLVVQTSFLNPVVISSRALLPEHLRVQNLDRYYIRLVRFRFGAVRTGSTAMLRHCAEVAQVLVGFSLGRPSTDVLKSTSAPFPPSMT